MVEKKLKLLREQGFSLIEVLIAVLVVGILAAIVVPIFMNQQREATAAQYKNDLIAAAFLVEQEAVDNNGLYPTYMPNEVKDNPRMSKFIYSYTDSRTEYCLQVTSPVGKFFVSSDNSTKVSESSCTQENIAGGSGTPWAKPIVPTPPAPVGTTFSWSAGAAEATANLKVAPQTCTLQPADQAEWGSSLTTQYRFTLKNFDRGGDVKVTNWSSNPVSTLALKNWLPGETIEITVQVSCVISADIDYSYKSDQSLPYKLFVPNFGLVAPVISSASASWEASQTVKATAGWSDLVCPAGSRRYDFDVQGVTTGAYFPGTSANSEAYQFERNDFRTSATNFSPDGKVKISVTFRCVLDSGRVISSPTTARNVEAGLLAPGKPKGLAQQWIQPALIDPSRISWNPVTCAQGTTEYRLNRTAPSAWNSGWITATNTSPTFSVGTTYTFHVEARCVSGAIQSAASPDSDSITFTADNRPPDSPAAPTNLRSSFAAPSDITPNRLTWNAVTCAWGTPQYLLTRTSPSGWNSGWQTALTDDPPLQAGTTYTFGVQSRCISGSLPSTVSASTPLTFTVTNVVPAKPATPSGFTNNNAGTAVYDNDRLLWSAVTCIDSTPQYIVRQTIKNGTAIDTSTRPTSAWMTTTYYNIPDSWLPAGSTVQFEVAAKCVSPAQVSSDITSYGTSAGARWTTTIPAPSAPRSASLDTWGNSSWTNPATTCPTGTTLQFHINNNGWASGWFTGTSRVIGGFDRKGGNSYTMSLVARCTGPNASSSNSAGVNASTTIPWTTAWTTAHADGDCSNFRSGPGTNYGVNGCKKGNQGPLNIYNYCSSGSHNWVRTDWGWTTTGNMQNVSLTYVKYGC